MNESQLNEALILAFPELAKELEEYVSWQDGMDTGAFLTYEDVFRPYIEQAIADNNQSLLQRAGDFIEDLFVSGDEYAVNVVVVGILEGLKDACDNNAVRFFLKEECLKEFNSMAC